MSMMMIDIPVHDFVFSSGRISTIRVFGEYTRVNTRGLISPALHFAYLMLVAKAESDMYGKYTL